MKTKIAINLGHKFVAIEAFPITIEGLDLALHKTLGKSGWTITHPGTGVALGKSSISKQEVENLAYQRIVTNGGAENVLVKLAQLPKAPAVETLELHKPVVKAPAAKADIPAIVAAIHNTVPLTDREKAAVVTALNSRTGQLKAKSPSAFGNADEQLACAAWQGLQPNGYKVGIFSCISLRGEAKDLFERLSKVRWPAALDKDKAALVALGAW
jgi:hypothetical protein